MNEDEALAWLSSRYAAEVERLGQFAKIVEDEALQQNLVAPSTLKTMWSRHLVDSAQLIDLVSAVDGSTWVDIGSGAGFPGLVVAALTSCHVILIEPRKLRAEFLLRTTDALHLANVEVACSRVQDVTYIADVISARAVAPMQDLFSWGANSSNEKTRWVLPKGKSAREEVAIAQRAWHGAFHVEQSITDPASLIVVASGVRRR